MGVALLGIAIVAAVFGVALSLSGPLMPLALIGAAIFLAVVALISQADQHHKAMVKLANTDGD